jgi:hypothetical protein
LKVKKLKIKPLKILADFLGFSYFMTVYETIKRYQLGKEHWFGPWHRMVVGGIIKKEFSKKYSGHPLPIVESKEGDKIFKVFDYPEHFSSRMFEIIEQFAKENIINRPQKTTEKPAPQLPQKTAYPEPKEKPTRPRKRIPLNKPDYSGNYSKK